MIEARFHGGPLDGEIRALRDRMPSYLVPVLVAHDLHPWCVREVYNEPCIAPTFAKVEYRLMLTRWHPTRRGYDVCHYEFVEPTDEALRHRLRQETPASRSTRAGTPSARNAA